MKEARWEIPDKEQLLSAGSETRLKIWIYAKRNHFSLAQAIVKIVELAKI